MPAYRIPFGLVLLSLAPLPLASEASADNSCINCHKNPAYFAQYPKLHEYYQQWTASPHKEAGVTCDDCHGGDASAEEIENAHMGVLHMNDRQSALHYQRQPDTCGQCHRDKQRQFVQSKHFTALVAERTAPTCSTCHPAMSRRPELRNIVLNACRTCHAEGNADNLPLIADDAEHIFNQLNIASGLLGWTRIHFESQDWPNGSQDRVENLEARYEAIVDHVHQFDLQQTADEAADILGALREIFEEARSARERQDQG